MPAGTESLPGPLVLNTRPETDSAQLNNALLAKGYRLLQAPMLKIAFRKDQLPPDISSCQGIVFTSANGVRAFAHLTDQRDKTAFCVGNATSLMAAEIGFENIQNAKGDVSDLAKLIIKTAKPGQGALFHPAARKTAGDLGAMIEPHGLTLQRQTVYDAIETTSLPDPVIHAISNHQVDVSCFFSPRTAESFVKLLKHHKLTKQMKLTTALCLSPAVAAQLAEIEWRETIIAEKPTQEFLLLALDSMFK